MFEVFKVNKSEGFAVTARPSFFKVFVAALLTATDPTNPPLMMWAASGQVRLVGRWLSVSDIGSRLTSFRVSRRQAASTPCTFPPSKPTHPALSITPIAPCASISHRKCLRLRLWLALYGVAGAHTAFSATSGIGLLRRADTRCFTLQKPNAQSLPVLQRLMAHYCTLNAFNRLVLHSRSLQARCFDKSRGVGGLRLPEVLHYATCTPSSSPPFEHLPTSPQSQNQALKRVRGTILIEQFSAVQKISEKRKPKCAE